MVVPCVELVQNYVYVSEAVLLKKFLTVAIV